MFFFSVYLFLMSCLSFIFIRSHIFLCLISLEFLVLSNLLLYYLFFCVMSFDYYMLIYMMVFFVCEGVLGLSVLVSLIRCHSNDYLSSLMLW
nr:NADH dehydrogenase subunit 4L [Acinopterus sp.]